MANPLFDLHTRQKIQPIGTLTKPAGGGSTPIQLPKTGIIQGLIIPISITISGSLSNPNALGIASAIRRVVLELNSGQRIVDISGAGYHWLVRDFLELMDAPLNYTDARSAVTTGTKNLDMFIPIALNNRDQMGLIATQSEQTIATLTIDWEQDATVATGATITGTATPYVVSFDLPIDPKNWPDLSTLHMMLEEQIAVPASGQFDHQIARGATLFGQYYLFTPGWTQVQLILQNNNIVYNLNPQAHRIQLAMNRGSDPGLTGGAITGTDKRILWDFMGSDGLGTYGTTRDTINTQMLTSAITRLTAVGSGTLYAIRRQVLSIAN